jgi:1-deoxy-D-xylulose-5-phosphate synthase
VHTEKGRGYAPAEEDDEKRLHDIGPFDPVNGKPHRRVAPGDSYTEAFGASLLREAELHPELVAITAAMPGSCGLLEFSRRYPDRFIDVGIAEQHAVTAAAGMAMAGLRPVVAIYSTFLNRAWDQLYYDVGLHHLPVIFCIDRAGITGDDGPSHNGVDGPRPADEGPRHDRARAVVPRGGRGHARRGDCDHQWPCRHPLAQVRSTAHSTVTGRGLSARQVRRGRCLLPRSGQDGRGLRGSGSGAARTRGHRCHGVGHARRPSPLDPVMLGDALRHRVVVTVEDGIGEGGVGSSIASALREVGGADHSRRSSRAASLWRTSRTARPPTFWPVRPGRAATGR